MKSPLRQRRAGVLLHPTSLPGPLDKGDLGPDAYRFVDFMTGCGLSVWQVLPLSPPHHDTSPYHCISVNAGNPWLISPQLLAEQGWLDRNVALSRPDCSADQAFRHALLRQAHAGFQANAGSADREALQAFIREHAGWLEDYALYQALRSRYHDGHWKHWPAPLRDRQAAALSEARGQLQDSIAQICFEQFMFFRQWLNLKHYANRQGVQLFGDMPIFVAYDSADVWANRAFFELDPAGNPLAVSGVPPDYFAVDGQHWGHPHYNWPAIRAAGFGYWTERMRVLLHFFDIIRIDHFRGFESYWEIPAHSSTARDGHWVKAPGEELFDVLERQFGPLPVVAEDLGLITPEVHALRDKYSFPGMMVLHFAFDGSHDNPYVPYKHPINSVVYTGTHDNDTTLGWFAELSPELKTYLADYLHCMLDDMPWPLIRCALASTSLWAILPMQDILALDGEHRMNTPGTTAGNWQWRFSWAQLPLDTPARLRHLSRLYGRC